MTYVQYAEPYPHARGDRFGSTAGRRNPHRGQDTAPGGLPVPALADGTVVGIRNLTAKGALENGILGKIVVVEHADGKFSGYAHLASISVSVGQKVSRGQALGIIGNTGYASSGRHLHYTLGNDKWGIEVGHVEDPLAYIEAHSAPPTQPASVGVTDWYTAAEHDGIPGPVFYRMAQMYSNRHFGTRLTEDGIPGTNTDKAIVRIVARDINQFGYFNGLRTTSESDGIRGKVYYKLVQEHSNRCFGTRLTPDGIVGPKTRWAETKIAAWNLNRAL